MDNIGVFTTTWNDHLSLLSTVLGHLENVGFAINPLKCEWAIQEMDFLGHWLTPNGIKPWHKKVDAILHLQPPTNMKQLRSFLGMVNYYRDMWPRRTHVLAPLTVLTGKHSFIWTPECQQAFDQMKALVSSDALLAFLDHTQPFDVETDASEYQLGSIIKQNATRCASHQVLHHLTPGSFAFRHNMFFDLPFLTDIIALQNTRQHLVDTCLLRKNAVRISHDYQVADQVLKKSVLSLSDKMKALFTGPHEITQVHMNGTVTIRLSDNVTERINIRWIKLYHS